MAMSEDASHQKSLELARLVWDEYQLRQTHYWRSVNRFALSIITLNIAPHFRVNDVAVLSQAAVFVIITALLLSLAASWLLNAEYIRLRNVRHTYHGLLPPGTFSKDDRRGGTVKWILWYPIGPVTTSGFLFGFSLLTIGNLLFVLGLLG